MGEMWVQFDLGSYSPEAQPVWLRLLKQERSPLRVRSRACKRLASCSFPELPLDMAERVVEHLLRNCASAGCYAATCKDFARVLPLVAARLEQDGIIYWTGNKPPLKPPLIIGADGLHVRDWLVQDPGMRKHVNESLSSHVKAAQFEDVESLLNAGWFSNFTIGLCLCAAGIDRKSFISDEGMVLAAPRLLELDLLTRVRIAGGPAEFARLHPMWSAQLAAAPFVVACLNTDNMHWATLRVWQHGHAEVFESIRGITRAADVQDILDLLTYLGWQAGKQIRFYYFVFDHYQQSEL